VPLAAAESLAFVDAFIAVKQAMSLAGARALAHLRLGPSQVRLLRVLAGRPNVRQGELARATGMDPSAASRALNSLISLGYVRRARSVADRRELLVGLTADGRRASARIERAWRRMAVLLTRELDGADLAALERLARKLRTLAPPDEQTDPRPAAR
jgi:DNA-binding MarR family transcriptional regulator